MEYNGFAAHCQRILHEFPQNPQDDIWDKRMKTPQWRDKHSRRMCRPGIFVKDEP